MGLFDFLKPRTQRTATGTAREPRPDHAWFVHQVLRDAAFQNPAHCVTTLASPAGRDWLLELWQQVYALCADGHQPPEISPDDILVHRVRAGSFPCTLLELPTPERETEAFFVALVLLLDMRGPAGGPETARLRYLTLELSGHRGDDMDAALCEWTEDNEHQIHEQTTNVTLEHFLSQVTRLTGQRHLGADDGQ